MRSMRVRTVAVVAAVLGMMAASGVARLGAQAKVDITGKWIFEVTTEAGGTTTPNVTFKQQGEKVTGQYSSETLGQAELTGTLKGQELTFSFTADVQGTSVPVNYVATVDSATTMKGRISIPGLTEGTFTAKKQ